MLLPFPHFKKLHLSDRAQIEEITSKFDNYSDFNFVSLWSWNTDNEIEGSILDGKLIIKFSDYITNEPLYSIIGEGEADEALRLIDKLAAEKGIDQRIRLLPEEVVKSIKNVDDFEIEEDPDNFDYILSVEEFSELKGNNYESKRRSVNKFSASYPHVTASPIDISDEGTQKQIIELSKLWSELKGHELEEAQNELKAIERLLQYSYIFPAEGVGLYDDGKLVGFSIDEIMPDGINALGHFQKADSRYKGIFTYLQRENLAALKKRGVKWINIEQDLGLESLRQAKVQLRPKKFLKKYTVRVKR